MGLAYSGSVCRASGKVSCTVREWVEGLTNRTLPTRQVNHQLINHTPDLLAETLDGNQDPPQVNDTFTTIDASSLSATEIPSGQSSIVATAHHQRDDKSSKQIALIKSMLILSITLTCLFLVWRSLELPHKKMTAMGEEKNPVGDKVDQPRPSTPSNDLSPSSSFASQGTSQKKSSSLSLNPRYQSAIEAAQHLKPPFVGVGTHSTTPRVCETL